MAQLKSSQVEVLDLGDLGDVTIGTAEHLQHLEYNESIGEWINVTHLKIKAGYKLIRDGE